MDLQAENVILRKRVAELESVLADIAVDYNINEFGEGRPIDPGHKRCVDMANAVLEKLKVDGFVFNRSNIDTA